MSGVRLSDIATKASTLTGSERLEVTQGGDTRYTDPAQLTDFVETDLTTLPAGLVTNAMVNASAAIADTKLATISTAGKVSNSATTATSANTASAIVARDANGDAALRDASLRQLVLRGDTSGTATIKVPAVAGTPTFTLPGGAGNAGEFLQTNGSGVLSWAAAAAAPSVAVYGHSSASFISSLSGSTYTAVPLNTEISDANGIGSLSSNQVTLVAGTYLFHAHINGFTQHSSQLSARLSLRLRNVSDSVTLGLTNTDVYTFGVDDGASTFFSPLAMAFSGVFTLGASKALALQFQSGSGLDFVLFLGGEGSGASAGAALTFLKIG